LATCWNLLSKYGDYYYYFLNLKIWWLSQWILCISHHGYLLVGKVWNPPKKRAIPTHQKNPIIFSWHNARTHSLTGSQLKNSSLCKLRLIVDTYPHICCHESVSWRSQRLSLKQRDDLFGGLGFRVGAFWTDLPIPIIMVLRKYLWYVFKTISLP